MTRSSARSRPAQEVINAHTEPRHEEDVTVLMAEHASGSRQVSRWHDMIASAACLAVSAVVLLSLSGIADRGSGMSALNGRFWPTMLSFGLIAIALGIALIRVFSKGKPVSDQDAITTAGVLRLMAAIVLVAVYVASWGTIQFAVTTTVVTAALTWLFGGRNLTSWLFFPLGLGVLFHVLFIVLLKVPIQ
ncbi:tripartite tricarboxylate transporter TctB family protein [Arthrobacter sp. NPDC089319]|uniref:tripartite tricarboxylate transporter TctB family protein n=1 Tax=Arthrobacter sp. NPDC089319 TaxID=3155915 RepID=UPI00341F98C6